MSVYKKIVTCCLFSVLSFSLWGCHSSEVKKAPKPAPTITQTNLDAMGSDIRRSGARIIQQGARLQIILPINRFFVPKTVQIKPEKRPTMELIANYLRAYVSQYHHAYPIRISGYTDEVGTRDDRQTRSAEYAAVVASYMWNFGFSASQVHSVGYGSKKPIASNSTPMGSSYNRHVLIQIN